MGRSWPLTLGNERGSALLIGLCLIAIMTLLGAALFEMSTIEVVLAQGDVFDTQAFYCAEAALARAYEDVKSNPAMRGEIAALGPSEQRPYPVPYASPGLKAVNGSNAVSSYAVTLVATGGTSGSSTLAATCTVQTGRYNATRTVQIGLQYPSRVFEHAIVSGDGSAAPSGFGNLYLGGTGAPTNVGGNWVGGADRTNGDLYVSGIAALRGAPVLTPCNSSTPPCDPTNKNPTLTVIGGLQNASTTFDQNAPGAFGTTGINPMPNISQVISAIRAAVIDQNGQPTMTGSYQGSVVYNLSQIFATLGTDTGVGLERNLKKPESCALGQAAPSGSNCQIWQDLVYAGVKMTTTDPGPAGKSYFFMGIPAAPSSNVIQGTPFSGIYANLVNASAELRQMGFAPGDASTMGNLASRLTALAGQDTSTFVQTDGASVTRLVDLTAGTDADGKTYIRSRPPIFFIDDGDWRLDAATSATTFAYNGIATVLTSQSVVLSGNIVYLNGTSNSNVGQVPAQCTDSNDRVNCGLADMLGLVAQKDIWVGETVQWVSGLMLAGRDFNYVDYSSANGCCSGPSNPVTFNGTVMATRQVTMARDWSDPQAGHENAPCTLAGGDCKIIQYVLRDPSDPGCASGCWKYLRIDANPESATYGTLIVDPTLPSFQGCEIPTSQTCPPGTRRITHFQLNVNYDKRLWQNSVLIPPGLATGTSGLAPARGTWKDCGANAQCS